MGLRNGKPGRTVTSRIRVEVGAPNRTSRRPRNGNGALAGAGHCALPAVGRGWTMSTGPGRRARPRSPSPGLHKAVPWQCQRQWLRAAPRL